MICTNIFGQLQKSNIRLQKSTGRVYSFTGLRHSNFFALESYKFKVTVRNFTFQFWSGTLIIYVISTTCRLRKIFQLSGAAASNTVFTLKVIQVENTEAWIDPKIVHLAFYKTKHQHTCTSFILNINILKSFKLEGKKVFAGISTNMQNLDRTTVSRTAAVCLH